MKLKSISCSLFSSLFTTLGEKSLGENYGRCTWPGAQVAAGYLSNWLELWGITLDALAAGLGAALSLERIAHFFGSTRLGMVFGST